MDQSVINSILTACPEIEAEDKRLDQAAGIDRSVGVNLFDEKFIKRSFTPNRFEQELESELLTCDQEELLKTEALYYYGRDQDDGLIADKIQYFRRRNESVEEIVRTLLEKLHAFESQIEKAKKKLAREGLTVQDI